MYSLTSDYCLLILKFYKKRIIVMPMEFKAYQNEQFGISINCPQEWDIAENLAGTVAAFLSPQEGPKNEFRENLTIAIEDLAEQQLTLDQYTEIGLQQIKQIISKFKIIEKVSNGTLASAPSKKFMYAGVQGKFKLNWHSEWTIINNKAYVLTWTGEKKEFNKLLPVFKQMNDSFSVR